jgi:hypothetical protein
MLPAVPVLLVHAVPVPGDPPPPLLPFIPSLLSIAEEEGFGDVSSPFALRFFLRCVHAA